LHVSFWVSITGLVRDNLKSWVDDMTEKSTNGSVYVESRVREMAPYIAFNMWGKGIALHLIHPYRKHVPIAAFDCMNKERFNR
jgi:hypothetical protein